MYGFKEDEEPLPEDELPEHLRTPPPVDFSKVFGQTTYKATQAQHYLPKTLNRLIHPIQKTS